MTARIPEDERSSHAPSEASTSALETILNRLKISSSFPASLLSRERLASYLAMRAQELRLPSITAMTSRVDSDAAEYARIEGLFSPPETWLFRYPESCEFLRARIAHGGAGVFRVLLAGCGGWCEPVSVACALLDGAHGMRRVEIDAIDRNPHVFEAALRMTGLQIRSGVPSWAEHCFEREERALVPKRDVCSVIRPRVADVGVFVEESVLRGDRYDAVLFRNVAIYLDDTMRARVFRGIRQILAPNGVLLVGHSEVFAAAEATGFEPVSATGVFALTPTCNTNAGSATSTCSVPDARARESKTASPYDASRSGVSRRTVPTPPSPVPPPSAPLQMKLQAAPNATDDLHPASFVLLARELESAGDLLGAWQVIGKALYLDRWHEEALVFAAQLAEKRGDRAEAERLRIRALRAHLANEAIREHGREGERKNETRDRSERSAGDVRRASRPHEES